jgi:hypothetical protein
MIDRQIWHGLAAAVTVLSLALASASGLASQSTETTGEIIPNLSGTWLVVNRLVPAPVARGSPLLGRRRRPSASVRHRRRLHLRHRSSATAEAEKIRDAEKAKNKRRWTGQQDPRGRAEEGGQRPCRLRVAKPASEPKV